MHAVARLALHPRDSEHSGIVGEDGPRGRDRVPERRLQRPRRHADEREHHARGRCGTRAGNVTGRNACDDQCGAATAAAAHDAVSRMPHPNASRQVSMRGDLARNRQHAATQTSGPTRISSATAPTVFPSSSWAEPRGVRAHALTPCVDGPAGVTPRPTGAVRLPRPRMRTRTTSTAAATPRISPATPPRASVKRHAHAPQIERPADERPGHRERRAKRRNSPTNSRWRGNVPAGVC